MQGPHAHSWSHQRRVSKLNELPSNGKKKIVSRPQGTHRYPTGTVAGGTAWSAYSPPSLPLSSLPPLHGLCHYLLMRGQRERRVEQRSQEFIPVAWEGSDEAEATGHGPPPRENMGHSFPYLELRLVLEEGGTEVGNGQDAIAPTTVWSRISTLPFRTGFPTRLISTNVSYIPPRASHCSSIIGTIPFVLTAKARGSMAGLQIYGPKTSASGKMEIFHLIFPIYPLNISGNPVNIYKANKIRLWKVERKANQLGILGPEEWHANEFPGFWLWLIYPRLEAEEVGNQEKTSTKEKIPQKSQGPRGAALKDRKLLDNNWSTLATTTKHTVALPLSTQQRPSGTPYSHPGEHLPLVTPPPFTWNTFQHVHWDGIRRAQVVSLDFPCPVVTKSHSSYWLMEVKCGTLNFYLHLAIKGPCQSDVRESR